MRDNIELETESGELLLKHVFNILENITAIQSKADTSNFIKVVISNATTHYEVAVGTSTIKINSYRID